MSTLVELDVVRRCTLRWPVAAALDLVATEPNAVRRCLVVAKIVHQVQDDPVLGEAASQALEVLRAEAKRRLNADLPAAPALTTRAAVRERTKERALA